ncbi:hypothetical protein A2U01_0023061, partial [Trifolium medium]|nr:hypothetical protein [Trifolium medium]
MMSINCSSWFFSRFSAAINGINDHQPPWPNARTIYTPLTQWSQVHNPPPIHVPERKRSTTDEVISDL